MKETEYTCQSCLFAIETSVQTPPFKAYDCHGIPPELASGFAQQGVVSATLQRVVQPERPACTLYAKRPTKAPLNVAV